MKKLLKSEICGSVNSTQNPHVAENQLKSQAFRLKKKKKKKRNTETQTRLGSAKRASQTHSKLLKLNSTQLVLFINLVRVNRNFEPK